jgi:hypothetical protein
MYRVCMRFFVILNMGALWRRVTLSQAVPSVMVHISFDSGEVGSVPKRQRMMKSWILNSIPEHSDKEKQTWKADNADGTEMATSDKPKGSHGVGGESFVFQGVASTGHTQHEQRELSKIGRSREEWLALRKNMLGAQVKRSSARHLRSKAIRRSCRGTDHIRTTLHLQTTTRGSSQPSVKSNAVGRDIKRNPFVACHLGSQQMKKTARARNI